MEAAVEHPRPLSHTQGLESGCVLHKRRERRSKSAVSSTCHRDDRHSAPSAQRPAPVHQTHFHRTITPISIASVVLHRPGILPWIPIRRSWKIFSHVRDHPALSKPKIVRLSSEISPTPSTFVVPYSFQSGSFRTRIVRIVAFPTVIVDSTYTSRYYIYIYIYIY